MPLTVQPVIFFLQEHTAESASFWDQVVHSNILNFLIAVVFLVWVFRKFNLLSLLSKRQEQIVKELKDAEEKRNKALSEMAEIEKRTVKLSTEVESILNEAQKTAEEVSQTLIKNAEAEAEKIVSNAQKRIALEQRTASRELEQRLMMEAVHGARQLLESTLNDEDKHRSVEEFVAALPDLYEKELKR